MSLSRYDMQEAMRRGGARFQGAYLDIKDRFNSSSDQRALLELINSLPSDMREEAMKKPEIAKIVRKLEAKDA